MNASPEHNHNGRIAIVGGVRTPFAKAFTDLSDLNASDLAKLVTQELIQRLGLEPEVIDEVVWGTVLPTMSNLNIGREVPIALGLSRVPGYTLGQQCASGIQSITSAAEHIQTGHGRAIIAGGSESMSNTPVVYKKRLLMALQRLQKARSWGRRLKGLRQVHLGDFLPTPPGIEEPSTGLSMGQHTELMAQINGISRKDQDAYTLTSHQRAAAARAAGRINGDLTPVSLPPKHNHYFSEDNIIRGDSSLEQLGQLRPVFDRKHGSLTAGNSSALTDGASVVMVMSETRAKELGLEAWGYIKSYAYVAIPPRPQLLLGPAYSTPLALDRAGLTFADLDLFEIHEAFAAQVLSVTQKLESDSFAKEELGRSQAVGKVDWDTLNVNGGSLAYGHPFAATGGRLVINLLQELRRRDKQLGLLTICTANAMGVSMVLERA
ncbi:MAG: acetyl-CoA C-acyltransferase [Candidatus Marinimicrobia bacterium]|nr:acetyl-CoA C-acyltransferase [Candidatus Neomarinimicrobiota bacterium]